MRVRCESGRYREAAPATGHPANLPDALPRTEERAPDSLHVQGAVTAVASFQKSKRDDKCGYLMRHPTARNQIGDTVSEAAIHSVQPSVTGTLDDWLVGHAEILFDPEQSFGAGTNTGLDRNQVQVRRAYALFGDLDRVTAGSHLAISRSRGNSPAPWARGPGR